MKTNVKVLIIDDDKNFCETTSDLLIEKGMSCDYVLSGQEGIDGVKKENYDFILLDMKMPTLSGLEVYREIKRISPKTIVIMASAFSMDEMIAQSLKEGVYAVLKKPLDIDRVIGIFKKANVSGSLVMIADDDRNAVETLKSALTDYGYKILIAHDGQEAVRLAKQLDCEVLFVDVKLPLINGLEVFLEIKQFNPQAKVVMITAYKMETEQMVQIALKEGAYGCLEKPFGINEVVTVIEKIAALKHRTPSSAPKNIKTLLVDDELNMLEGLGDLLQENGYDVVCASTYSDAFTKAHDESPDVLIADVKLPDGDGRELCKKIKISSKFEMKTICYTGQLQIDKTDLEKYSIDAVVSKTDGPDSILNVLQKINF